jgi:cobalt-zinc-cadmium efflux system outer membrane protein
VFGHIRPATNVSLVAGALIFTFLVSSQRARASEAVLTFEEAVATALSDAPQIAARMAAEEAARSLALSAGRLPDPEGIVGLDNLPVSGSDAWSTTRDFMTMRKVGVMQQGPRGAKRRLQRERAAAQTGIAQAELAATRLEVARMTAEAWILAATTQATVEHLRSLEPEVELQAAAARAALAGGRGTGAEALAAQVAVAELSNRMLRAKSDAARARLGLARWIGEHATRPVGKLPSMDQLPVHEAELVESVHRHAALMPYERRLAEARLEVALARAERRPDWSAELSFAKRGPEFSDMASLQFRIELPLLARYRQNPVIAARRAELGRVEAEREAEVRMHVAEVRQMLLEWGTLGEHLARYEREILPLARERSKAALAAYRAGSGALQPALDAFSREIDQRIEYLALQNERGRAWAYLRYLTTDEVQHP